MRHVIETETMTSEEYVPKRVVPPERQQNLEVFCPSMGHACIRLQIGLKAHAQAHGDVSHSSKQRRRTEIRGAYLYGTWSVRAPGSSCSIFWRAQQKTFTEEGTTSELRIKRPQDAGKT